MSGGALPYQLIYVPSRLWKWVILVTATLLALMLGYPLAFTAPPGPVVALLFVVLGLPLAVLVSLLPFAGRRTIWEVTDTHFRQLAGGKTVFKVALEDIGSTTESGAQSGAASVVIKNRAGKVIRHLVSGPQLTYEDLRFLYGAIASSLTPLTENASQNPDWSTTPPAVEKRWAGRRPGLWGEYHAQLFVTPPVIMTVLGALFAIMGLLPRYSALLPIGIPLFAGGAALLVFAVRYLERRRVEGRLEF